MKNSIVKRYSAMLLVIALQFNAVPLSAQVGLEKVKADLEKIKDLNERFNFVKKVHKEFKDSGRAYNECVQKNCKNELEALVKITEDLDKTKWTETTLRQVLMNSKIAAEEAFQHVLLINANKLKKNMKQDQKNI